MSKAFLAEDYEVMIGTRNPAAPEAAHFQQNHPGIAWTSFSETAQFGNFVVLAVSGDAVKTVMESAGRENLAGKVVIDVTHPISKEEPENGVLKLFTDINFSLMEQLQEMVPGARFVKAFNSVGSTVFYKPGFGDTHPTMFIAGNDEDAKKG